MTQSHYGYNIILNPDLRYFLNLKKCQHLFIFEALILEMLVCTQPLPTGKDMFAASFSLVCVLAASKATTT